MMPPDPGSWENAITFIKGVVETVSMAFFGTICAAFLALPFGFLAARNIVSNSLIHHAARRFLDIIRGIDTLIWALIWVGVVGLGPFAGVLAIITSDFGAFGKLFSEAIEAADQKPVEGIVASGGSRLEGIRFGIVPQILPVLLGQILYFFESNTRTTTIIGIVGAGGIGLYLTETIRTYLWEETSFIILLILITVAAIDWISGKLRIAIIGARPV
jgi:phosphonate transport system permease protein